MWQFDFHNLALKGSIHTFSHVILRLWRTIFFWLLSARLKTGLHLSAQVNEERHVSIFGSRLMKFSETLIRKESTQCQVLWRFNVQYPSIPQLQNSKSSLNVVEWHTYDKQQTMSSSFVRSLNDYFFGGERLKKKGRKKNNKGLSLRPCLRNESHQMALNVIFFWRFLEDR